MDNLFTPEVIQQFLLILSTAAEGSVTVLITYFLLPVLMLLITSLTTLFLVYYAVKKLSECLHKWIGVEKVYLTSYELEGSVIIKANTHGNFTKLIDLMRTTGHSPRFIHESDIDRVIGLIKASEKGT
jgi:hypothetical protein